MVVVMMMMEVETFFLRTVAPSIQKEEPITQLTRKPHTISEGRVSSTPQQIKILVFNHSPSLEIIHGSSYQIILLQEIHIFGFEAFSTCPLSYTNHYLTLSNLLVAYLQSESTLLDLRSSPKASPGLEGW